MTSVVNNESFSIEERLEIALALLELKELEIVQLKSQLDTLKSDRGWEIEQAGYQRMGL